MIKEELRQIKEKLTESYNLWHGHYRQCPLFLASIIGACVVKNDIISQVIAALQYIPALMGDMGAAFLDRLEIMKNDSSTKFKDLRASKAEYCPSYFNCKACPNLRDIIQISLNCAIFTCWGGRCELWGRTSIT